MTTSVLTETTVDMTVTARPPATCPLTPAPPRRTLAATAATACWRPARPAWQG